MASTETTPIVTTLYGARHDVVIGTTTTITNSGGATRYVSGIIVTNMGDPTKRSRVTVAIDGTEVMDLCAGNASFGWNSGNGGTFSWANTKAITLNCYDQPASVSILAFEATP